MKKPFFSRRTLFVLRCLSFVTGMFIASAGVALITNADLGTTPITSIPYVLDAIFPLSLGIYTWVTSIVFLVIQKIVLGPDFHYSHLLQLPPTAFFGFGIDFWMWQTAAIPALPYSWRMAFLLLGIVLLAAGVLIQVVSNVTVMPGEGVVVAIAYRTRHSFGSIKVLLDVGMVLSSAIIGYLVLGSVVGIREGTLLSAVLTGLVIRFITFCARRLRGGQDGE